MLNEFAPAKLNLYLHITGRDQRGYHELDSLVAFTGVGDEIRLEPTSSFQFMIEGPQSKPLKKETPDNNLIVKAAKSFAELVGKPLNLKLTLIKNLPVASGIGGGSSDAAAALRALAKYWGIAAGDPRLHQAARQHGQDVPVCLKTENNYITESGTASAPTLPHADIVLINPNKALPTADVYKTYKDSGHKFSEKMQLQNAPKNLMELIKELKSRHNDLYEPACHLMPEIRDIIDVLESSLCLLARMSGSGATCFGLYVDRNAARKAAADILNKHPDWWVVQSYIPYRVDERRS